MTGRDSRKNVSRENHRDFRLDKGPEPKCYGRGFSVKGLTDTQRVGHWSYGGAISPLMKPDE